MRALRDAWERGGTPEDWARERALRQRMKPVRESVRDLARASLAQRLDSRELADVERRLAAARAGASASAPGSPRRAAAKAPPPPEPDSRTTERDGAAPQPDFAAFIQSIDREFERPAPAEPRGVFTSEVGRAYSTFLRTTPKNERLAVAQHLLGDSALQDCRRDLARSLLRSMTPEERRDVICDQLDAAAERPAQEMAEFALGRLSPDAQAEVMSAALAERPEVHVRIPPTADALRALQVDDQARLLQDALSPQNLLDLTRRLYKDADDRERAELLRHLLMTGPERAPQLRALLEELPLLERARLAPACVHELSSGDRKTNLARHRSLPADVRRDLQRLTARLVHLMPQGDVDATLAGLLHALLEPERRSMLDVFLGMLSDAEKDYIGDALGFGASLHSLVLSSLAAADAQVGALRHVLAEAEALRMQRLPSALFERAKPTTAAEDEVADGGATQVQLQLLKKREELPLPDRPLPDELAVWRAELAFQPPALRHEANTPADAVLALWARQQLAQHYAHMLRLPGLRVNTRSLLQHLAGVSHRRARQGLEGVAEVLADGRHLGALICAVGGRTVDEIEAQYAALAAQGARPKRGTRDSRVRLEVGDAAALTHPAFLQKEAGDALATALPMLQSCLRAPDDLVDDAEMAAGSVDETRRLLAWLFVTRPAASATPQAQAQAAREALDAVAADLAPLLSARGRAGTGRSCREYLGTAVVADNVAALTRRLGRLTLHVQRASSAARWHHALWQDFARDMADACIGEAVEGRRAAEEAARAAAGHGHGHGRRRRSHHGHHGRQTLYNRRLKSAAAKAEAAARDEAERKLASKSALAAASRAATIKAAAAKREAAKRSKERSAAALAKATKRRRSSHNLFRREKVAAVLSNDVMAQGKYASYRAHLLMQEMARKTWQTYVKKCKAKQKLTPENCLNLIYAIYEKKIKADAAADDAERARDPLPKFADEFFINKFGLKKIAKRYMSGMSETIRGFEHLSLRLRMFGRLVGVLEAEKYHPNICDGFLFVLQDLLPSFSEASMLNYPEGALFVTLRQAQIVVCSFFAFPPPPFDLLLSPLTDEGVEELRTFIVRSAISVDEARRVHKSSSLTGTLASVGDDAAMVGVDMLLEHTIGLLQQQIRSLTEIEAVIAAQLDVERDVANVSDLGSGESEYSFGSPGPGSPSPEDVLGSTEDVLGEGGKPDADPEKAADAEADPEKAGE